MEPVLKELAENKAKDLGDGLFSWKEGKHLIQTQVMGVGRTHAAFHLGQRLGKGCRPTEAIITGTAAALTELLEPGAIIVPQKAMTPDYGFKTPQGFQVIQLGELPGTERAIWVGPEPQLFRRACSALSGAEEHFHRTTHATLDHFLAEDQSRASMRGVMDAHSMDMEVAPLLLLLTDAGIPAVAIKAISDLAGPTAADTFAKNLKRAAERAAHATMTLLLAD